MFDNKNKPKGLKRVYLATLNSLRAFNWLVKNEAAFRQELVLLIVVIPITFLFDITNKEQLILIIVTLFILFTEVLNTAIESVVDRVGLEIHPLSGLAKDLGSAAVFISLVIAVCTWAAVLI
ncbi:diacylglycerol kinase [Psychrosphaera sp. B3R10]|uniref:Diacylglycerol kinase n=1 Tax=Psychrosphaera algicola TaxID=3023714 RepID=A0ABT5FGG2_9GAMM|nr:MULTISPECIES: diacylglycerol kinase [unclassified Psychrosphaera]MBU2883680.1 diacylglycerol kinase [Psychrosphaera sp. I2R16]MBU2991030.1 diacylglycerol kinase [Psychrosphaera sp. B3R10]MDC2890274.1 diacylglycerol kinase [Psychrosphaera sp. G1-22]MDO6719089.1 diacylglycerol kinase [Psychrosphaera sp. 1_MG-2023]